MTKTPRRSSRLLKPTYREYPRFHKVKTFVRRVSQRHPLLVVLFGSVARGDYKQHSDADVLVLFDKPDKLDDVYKDCEGTVHPIVKTLDQMEQFIREGEPFYIEMIEDGIPLYDADGMFKKLARLVRDAKRAWGLKRTRTGWEWTRAEPVWSA
jgi:predicted nucleotidyltransferase